MSAPAFRRLSIPPQHGAWAYLALPLLLGFLLSGVTWLGVLFAVSWVLAYPASYYLGRAVAIRLRRGSWSRLAVRERTAAVPWLTAAGVGGFVLVIARPWLIAVGVGLAAAWFVGVRLSLAGRERGFGNDLLLVGQAVVALPLLVWLQDGAVSPAAWQAALICLVYFVGSVIHVKSLIRESDDRRWRVANIGVAVAGVLVVLGLMIVSRSAAWLLLPAGAALLRTLLLRPTARPGVIGAVETVVSVLVLVGAVGAVG